MRRAAIEKAAGRPSTKKRVLEQRDWILIRDLCRCVYCGWTPPRLFDLNMLVIDHVVPLCDGGTYADENLVTACWDCNAAKGQRPVEVFLLALIGEAA